MFKYKTEKRDREQGGGRCHPSKTAAKQCHRRRKYIKAGFSSIVPKRGTENKKGAWSPCVMCDIERRKVQKKRKANKPRYPGLQSLTRSSLTILFPCTSTKPSASMSLSFLKIKPSRFFDTQIWFTSYMNAIFTQVHVNVVKSPKKTNSWFIQIHQRSIFMCSKYLVIPIRKMHTGSERVRHNNKWSCSGQKKKILIYHHSN